VLIIGGQASSAAGRRRCGPRPEVRSRRGDDPRYARRHPCRRTLAQGVTSVRPLR